MAGFTSVTTALTAGTIGELAYGSDADLLVQQYPLLDAADVPPGRGVSFDAGNASAKLFAAVPLLGVAFNDGSLPIESSAFSSTGNNRMPVLRRGKVWVLLSQDVTPADPVYCQTTANGGGKPVGSFRKDNDGGNAVLVAGAQWGGVYTAAGTKAVLQLNLPA